MEIRSTFWLWSIALCLAPITAVFAQDAEAESRDLSASPIRELNANIRLTIPSWNESRQQTQGAAIIITFDGSAAPLALVGKSAPADVVRVSPEVNGDWKWQSNKRLEFFPTTGWLKPGEYTFKAGRELLAEDCKLKQKTDFGRSLISPRLTARFYDRDYYIDPATPTLQQLTCIVDFSQPVKLEEARRHLTITSATGSKIFQAGSEPQILAEPKDPRRFYLRSPLMQPVEKEDLVVFSFSRGLTATAGGNPTNRNLETKLTAYSKTSKFFVNSVGAMLRKTPSGNPEQALLVEFSIPAQAAVLADSVTAWKLPPPRPDKYGRIRPWKKEQINDDVLRNAEPLDFELITDPGSPPLQLAVALRVPHQPGGTVWITLPKDTVGPGGFVTPENFGALAKLPAIPKEASLLGNGGLLALNGEHKISVQSRGLDHLQYTVARVQTHQINHLVSQSRGSFESPSFNGNFGLESVSDYEQSVVPIAKRDDYTINDSSFDFTPLLDSTHGLFHLTVQGVRAKTEADNIAEGQDWIPIPSSRSRRTSGTYPAGDRPRDQRFILVTDLGLIMKEAADGQRSVYVQSFSERGPVGDVEISVLSKNGTVLKTAITDANGRAQLPSLRGLQREKAPVALIAKKGDDLAFIPWAKNDRHLNVSRFDVGGTAYSQASELSASLFTERGIYRPGEPIHIGGIVRQLDWSGDLSGLPLELVITNAKHDIAGRYPLNLADGGVFSKTVPTAETAPTGPWRIHLERPKPEGAKSRRMSTYLGGINVRVEEFQPDRLKIKADFTPKKSKGWSSPDDLAVGVQLDTLFGIPAANRRVAATLHLRPTTPTFSNWPGWKFGISDGRWHQTKEIDLPDGKTDKSGSTRLPLNLEVHTAPMLHARVELEGFEADGGRGVRTELSTLVSRQSYLIGHKTDSNLTYLDGREPAAVSVVAIGSDSKPKAVDGLTRMLIQTRHVSVLTKQKNGSLAYESQPQDTTLESIITTLPAEKKSLQLPLDQAGTFRYEFRNATGQTLCSIPFFVAGKGDISKDLERSGELEIKFPQRDYLPGEELEFSLTTPFTGAGLITIERDTVLEEMWFKCDTKTSVQKIRLPDNLDGGAYLHVVMARALDSPDVFLNPLASGVAPIKSARGKREMAVTLRTPDRVRPGERLAINYTAPKNGHMVIWAVDEGIHLVSKYKAPDPLKQLLPTAALEVETYQLLDVLLPEFSLLRKALSIGGGGGGAEANIPELQLGINPFRRRRDPPVVFWSGFVPCGPESKQVFYDVPEYFAGRLKIMAVAVDAEAVGVGQTESIVKGDFVLTATTPLFVVPGDEFTASVTVANQLEGDAATDQVKVSATQEGGVEILEGAIEAQTIGVGEEVTVQFRCRATAKLGNAELKFTAASGESRQETRSSFSVRPGVARAARVQSGWFRDDSHEVSIDHPMFDQFSEREAIVSTTPLGLAHGLSAFLKEYPHGCTEQITSRAFPWLVLQGDANFGVDKDEATKAIADTMNQLARRQGSNGGFGYWSTNSNDGFDYLTVYVGHFLTECKSSGFHVPARLYQSTMRRLRYMADAKVTRPRTTNGRKYYWQTRWEAEMRAAAIYLLTRNEEVTTNYALKLQDFMEAEVPRQYWHRDSTAAWLASTWRLLKKESAAKPLIAAHRVALKKTEPNDWERGYYYYTTKLTREATAFTVLCRHFPEIAKKLTYEEMKPLTEMIQQADFHTLSAAWSVQALKAYADLAEGSGVKVGIAAGDQVLAKPATGQLRVKVPEGKLRFFFADDAPNGLGAWYQTIEKGFAKNLPEEPDGKHIQIKRELLDADGNPVTQSKLGQTLIAKLTIRNLTRTELPNLAITEMLPGGFEFAPPGEPDSLRPGLNTRQGTDYIDIREDRALIYLGLRKEGSLTLQYALRPTCPGSFVIPPPYAEDMYESKVRANGAAGKFIVLPRE